MTSIKFTKMSAGGNDFIVIDGTGPGSDPIEITEDFVRRVCRRAASVGADGLILLTPSDTASIRMNYYNSDGGRAGLCGNGVRCVARIVAVMRLAPASGMTIETDVGEIEAWVEQERASFRLPMGTPVIEKRTLLVPGGLDAVSREIEATYVMAGVPHLVVVSRNCHRIPDDIFLKRAARLRSHESFGSDGTNVDYITVKDRENLDIRCFERGIEGETLSSGSGCIASVLAAASGDLTGSVVTCRARAGFTSRVTLEKKDDGTVDAVLEGDARIVYTGSLNDEALKGFAP